MRWRLVSARHQTGFSRGILRIILKFFFAKLKPLVEYKTASQAVSWDIVEFLRMALAKNNTDQLLLRGELFGLGDISYDIIPNNCVMMMMMMMNCFCGMVDRRKAFSLISSRDNCQKSSPSRISNTPSRVWTCAEPEFRLSWMKLCSSDNHYTMACWGLFSNFINRKLWHKFFLVNFETLFE